MLFFSLYIIYRGKITFYVNLYQRKVTKSISVVHEENFCHADMVKMNPFVLEFTIDGSEFCVIFIVTYIISLELNKKLM